MYFVPAQVILKYQISIVFIVMIAWCNSTKDAMYFRSLLFCENWLMDTGKYLNDPNGTYKVLNSRKYKSG